MKAEIISCGTELLLGHIVDTTEAYFVAWDAARSNAPMDPAADPLPTGSGQPGHAQSVTIDTVRSEGTLPK